MDKFMMVFAFIFLNVLLVSYASPAAEPDPDPDIIIQIRQQVNGAGICDNCGPEIPKPTPEKTVKAAFTRKNAQFSNDLREPNSTKYKQEKKKIEDYVKTALKDKLQGKIVDYSVEFFRNGSVIVDGNVIIKDEDLNTANQDVDQALKSAGMEDVFVGVRLCVPGQDRHLIQEECVKMNNDLSPNLGIICVNAQDRYDCLKGLRTKEVDVVRVDVGDIYLASEIFGPDEVSVIATTRLERNKDEPYRYLGVAVVRKSTINGIEDLKGSKSCFTGYGKTTGWKIPLAKLLEDGQLKPNCSQSASVVEIELSAVSSYFSQACLPGPWGPDAHFNNKFKHEFNNLCQLCNTSCGSNDGYAGYTGALECLIANGDVAWTSYDVVNPFFESKQDFIQDDPSDFGFLCPDGSIIDLDSDITGCYWAARPWTAWLSRKYEEDKGEILPILSEAVERSVHGGHPKEWGKVLLGIKEGSVIKDLHPPVSPEDYLKQAGFYTVIDTKTCTEAPVRLCVKSAIAHEKCEELAKVLQSHRILPSLTCIRPDGDDCVHAIEHDNADIVSLDVGDIFKKHKDEKITPIINEVYGKTTTNYFAVAVVRNGSTINNLSDLKAKNSCHTGIGKTAGWKIPVATLIEAGLLKKDDCDYAMQVGNFFTESCAPGALLSKYDKDGTNPHSLCNLCVGDLEAPHPLETQCNRNASESFYGYTGAFRCLVQGGGDVAFIKHSTVPENTDGNGKKEWNRDLKSDDFQLVCKDNKTADISAYETCNLANVPSHKVVTRYGIDAGLKEQMQILLLRASKALNPKQDGFALFGNFGPYHDIIFQSSVTELSYMSKGDVKDLLNGDYYDVLRALENC